VSGAQLRNVWLFIAFVALCSLGLWFALLRDGMPHSSAVVMPLIGFAALVAVFDTRWLALDLHLLSLIHISEPTRPY